MTSSDLPTPQPVSRRLLWVLGGLLLFLAANWVAAVARFSVNCVFWDQWGFLEPLFYDQGLWDVFARQHGPHRQGIAFVFTSWIYDLSNWDARVEGLWGAACLLVAAVLMLRWKYRLTGRLGWADLWIPLAALALRQYETIIIVPNISHGVFPVVLMLAAVLVLLGPLTLRRWLVLGGIGFLALFTGFAIFVWAALLVLAGMHLLRALWSRDWPALVAPGAGALALLVGLGLFLWGYVFNPASPGATFPHWPLSDYPKFLVHMLASRMDLVGHGSWVIWGGSLMLILTVLAMLHTLWGVLRREPESVAQRQALFFFTLGLGFALFTALGRVHLGPEAGEAPRYTPLMLSLWLGLVAWAAAQRWQRAPWLAAVAGWMMVIPGWADIWDRPWKDLPGTLGMSSATRSSIIWTNGDKIRWLMAWQESGDWREADRRVPQGVHPNFDPVQMEHKVRHLQDHGLSFFADADTPYAWLPWWNPTGSIWVQAMGGEHHQWMAEEAMLLIDGEPDEFVNVKLHWKSPNLPGDPVIELQFGDNLARLRYSELVGGVSLPTRGEVTRLTLRSVEGVVPLHPPQDTRLASFLVTEPLVTKRPEHTIRWWPEGEDGWLPDTIDFGVTEGFNGWEGQAAFGWTTERMVIHAKARQTYYLNLRLGGRYGPADEGPVQLVIDGEVHTYEWPQQGGIDLSVAVAGGRAHTIELLNPAGAFSPLELGESSDYRRLAIRLTRLSLDPAPDYPLAN